MTAYGRAEAIAVGELGAVWLTTDGGKTWEVQPNITSNSLQAIAFLGGSNLWVAGRGGSILKRSEALSTVRTSSPKVPPVLRLGAAGKPKPRQPLITIPDDGDIPQATLPLKKDQ